MIRRDATPLCHCGGLDTGVEHWSRCIVCHPEQYLGMVRSNRMVGWCELHRRTGAQCIAVAIYVGIVAMGEWAQRMWISSARRNYAECCMPHCTWPVEVPADMHGPHVCRDCATPDLPDFMELGPEPDYSSWCLSAEDVAAMVRGDADE